MNVQRRYWQETVTHCIKYGYVVSEVWRNSPNCSIYDTQAIPFSINGYGQWCPETPHPHVAKLPTFPKISKILLTPPLASVLHMYMAWTQKEKKKETVKTC